MNIALEKLRIEKYSLNEKKHKLLQEYHNLEDDLYKSDPHFFAELVKGSSRKLSQCNINGLVVDEQTLDESVFDQEGNLNNSQASAIEMAKASFQKQKHFHANQEDFKEYEDGQMDNIDYDSDTPNQNDSYKEDLFNEETTE